MDRLESIRDAAKRTAMPAALTLLVLAIAVGLLPRIATTLEILGRPDEALQRVPIPVTGVAIGFLILSVLIVAVRRGWVRTKRATPTELLALVTVLATPMVAVWPSGGFPSELWWLAVAVPFLMLHASGRLDPLLALVAAVAIPAMASIPTATTYSGTDKLNVVLIALHSGWPLRSVAALTGVVLALIAARRGSGALRGLAIGVALWLSAGVVRDGAALYLGAAFESETVDVAWLLHADAIAQWADRMLAPVIAIGVASLAIGWLARERVAAPAILFVSALFAVGPVHDPWLVDDGPIEPWHLGGVDVPATLSSGWQLSDVFADEFSVDAQGQRHAIEEPVNELAGIDPVVAILYASPEAQMADVIAAGFAHTDHYHRVFLMGPIHDPKALRAATRRWPAAGAMLRHHRIAVELFAGGGVSCPASQGTWLSDPPNPTETVREFLDALPCHASADPPPRPLPPNWRTVEPEWLLRAPSMPSNWRWSALWGLVLAGLAVLGWVASSLRALRRSAPEDRSPNADDPIWPPWILRDEATTRWVRKRGGSPYRDADETRFAGPSTEKAARRALRPRARLGAWRAVLVLWAVALAFVFAGLVWAAVGH